MPLYEYSCENCGHQFERIQKFSDPPVETCPKCGGGPVRKLVSSPAFQFKGSGWYVTDYARKSESTKDKSGSAGGAGASTDKSAKDTSKETSTDTSTKESKPKESSSPKSDG